MREEEDDDDEEGDDDDDEMWVCKRFAMSPQSLQMGVGRDERRESKCSVRLKLNLDKEHFFPLDFFISFCS